MTLHYGHDMTLDAITTRARADQRERRQGVHRQRQTQAERRDEAMEREILKAALAPGAGCLSTERARPLRGRRARDRRAGGRRHPRSRLSQLPGGARAAAGGDVERRPQRRRRTSCATAWRAWSDAPRRSSGRLASPPRHGVDGSACGMPSRRRRGGGARRARAASTCASARPPELPGGVTTGDEVTRSLAVAVRGPVRRPGRGPEATRVARRRRRGPLPRAAHGGGSPRGLVHVHLGPGSGSAGAGANRRWRPAEPCSGT